MNEKTTIFKVKKWKKMTLAEKRARVRLLLHPIRKRRFASKRKPVIVNESFKSQS